MTRYNLSPIHLYFLLNPSSQSVTCLRKVCQTLLVTETLQNSPENIRPTYIRKDILSTRRKWNAWGGTKSWVFNVFFCIPALETGEILSSLDRYRIIHNLCLTSRHLSGNLITVFLLKLNWPTLLSSPLRV